MSARPGRTVGVSVSLPGPRGEPTPPAPASFLNRGGRGASLPERRRAMRTPRFRVRTLMIAVAVVGVGAAFWCRAEGFRRCHEYHLAQCRAILTNVDGTYSGHEGDRTRWFHYPKMVEFTAREYATLDWHTHLVRKYRLAARRPWLPVAPDPPPPK